MTESGPCALPIPSLPGATGKREAFLRPRQAKVMTLIYRRILNRRKRAFMRECGNKNPGFLLIGVFDMDEQAKTFVEARKRLEGDRHEMV